MECALMPRVRMHVNLVNYRREVSVMFLRLGLFLKPLLVDFADGCVSTDARTRLRRAHSFSEDRWTEEVLAVTRSNFSLAGLLFPLSAVFCYWT